MSKQFYQVGGSLPANSKSYIKRDADENLYNYLKDGKYCYVLNARQVGKSSLRVHTSKRLEDEGYSCINIDLTSIGSKAITEDEWYFSFVLHIIEELGLNEDEFVNWWDSNEKLTVVNRFFKVFDKFILEVSSKNIIIMIDEVDYILGIKKDFSANDFFAVIRTFYNLRSEDERYYRLTFALFGVATPEDLMRDSSRTPFNIAHSVKIEQFKLEESLSLIEGLKNKDEDSQEILERIFEWTSGTPYLTQKILDYIAHNPIHNLEDIDNVVDILFLKENFKEINISNIQNRIVSNETYNVKMLYLISDIINNGSRKVKDGSLEQIYLKLSGLVKEENNFLIYTNKIYEEVFTQRWLTEALGKIDRPFSKDLQRWIELNKSTSALLKGEVLDNAKEWASKRDDLTSEESEYLRLSSQLEQESILHEEKKKEESKRVKHLTVFSVVLLAFSMGIAYIYLDAKEQEQIAREQLETIEKFTYDDYCGKGDKYFLKKNYNKAIESYEKALGIYDAKKEAYIRLAKVYQAKKNYSKAIEVYKKLVDIDKNDVKNWNALGYTYYLLDDYNNSLLSLEKALDINSSYYYAYNNKGINYLKMKKYQKAMNIFAKTIDINPRYSKPYINIGNIHFKDEKYNKAISFYEESLEFEKNYWIYSRIGDSYLKQNKYKNAIKAYTHAIKFNSEQKEEVYWSIGLSYFKLEQYIKAKESFENAIKLNSNIEIDFYTMGVLYDKLEEFKKAKEMYLQALVETPKDIADYNMNGKIYSKLKDYKKALLSYSKIIEIDKNSYEALVEIGIIYNELGKEEKHYDKAYPYYKKALIKFHKALEINSDDNTYYNMGNTYYRMGKRTYDKAIEQYKKAIELNQYNDKAYNDLAYIYLRQKKYQVAINTYEKVIEINPKHYKAYNSMGVAYVQLARNINKEINDKKAIESYRESIKINPEYDKSYMNIFYLQLFNRESFDLNLEYKYSNTFKNHKEIFIQFEMLKILKKITNGESYEDMLNIWKLEYQDIRFKSSSFSILYKWARKHKRTKIRKKLLNALNIFYKHK